MWFRRKSISLYFLVYDIFFSIKKLSIKYSKIIIIFKINKFVKYAIYFKKEFKIYISIEKIQHMYVYYIYIAYIYIYPLLEEYVTYAIQLCRHGAREEGLFLNPKVGPWNLQKRTFWLAPRWKRGCQFYRGAHYRQRRCKLYRFQIYNFSWALWVTRARFRGMVRDYKNHYVHYQKLR